MLEEIAYVGFAVEVADAFGADDSFGPAASHEVVELVYVERLTVEVDVGAYAVFLGFAFVMVVVMVVIFVVMVVVVVVVVVFVVVVVVVVVVFLVFFVFLIFVFVVVEVGAGFYFLDPGGGGCHLVEVEHGGVEDAVEVDVAVVAFYDFGFSLEVADDLAELGELVWGDFGGFVEEDDVAEFDLLDDEVGDVVFVGGGVGEVESVLEFVAHAEGVDDGEDAVEAWEGVGREVGGLGGDGDDGLGDGFGLADAAGFDDDVVEAVGEGDVAELVDEVEFEGAADAAVLEWDEAVVGLSDDAALLDEGGVDVDLSDVVDDDGEADALTVGEEAVEECGFAAAEVAGE